MLFTSTIIFRDDSLPDNDGSPSLSPPPSEPLHVHVLQSLQERHGLHIWPCSYALAHKLWRERARLQNSHVLELGAGTALPGILAAKLGARVTLTDAECFPDILLNMREACKINKVECEVLPLTWGAFSGGGDAGASPAEVFIHGAPDLIIGADVLYESSCFEDLFATVRWLLRGHGSERRRKSSPLPHSLPSTLPPSTPSLPLPISQGTPLSLSPLLSSVSLAHFPSPSPSPVPSSSPTPRFITAYQHRSSHRSIEFLLQKWGLKVVAMASASEYVPARAFEKLQGASVHVVEIELQ